MAKIMSPLIDLPPRPENAHTRNSEHITTGFELSSQKTPNISKKRRKSRVPHDTSQKPQKLPKDPVFAHFEERADKKDDASCVFLLWGSENSERFKTWAVDIETTKLESDDLIFASMADRYDKELGFWRRWFSFRKFSGLKPVTVCIYCFYTICVHTNVKYSSGLFVAHRKGF